MIPHSDISTKFSKKKLPDHLREPKKWLGEQDAKLLESGHFQDLKLLASLIYPLFTPMFNCSSMVSVDNLKLCAYRIASEHFIHFKSFS